jgi:hypothetical protein
MLCGNGRLAVKRHPDGAGLVLRFQDGVTKTNFFTVTLSIKGLTHILRDGWEGSLPFHYEFNDAVPLGKKSESKKETVFIPLFSGDEARYQDSLDAHLRPFETDGWKANRESADNILNMISYDPVKQGRLMSIEFHRYI